jgi:hypothetical protein
MEKGFAMKKGLLLLLVAVVAAVSRPACAVICSVDNVPAATLLLPYFEVDLNDPNGIDTVFTVVNASATAGLAHVVLWTDLGIPTYAFDVYLTGYDVEKVDLRLLFAGGVAPRTATAGQDPTDQISPKGPLSQDINFASCTGHLPVLPLAAPVLAHIRAAHTGLASATFSGNCSGRALGDNVARGYVTIDTVAACTSPLPDDPTYYSTPWTTTQNIYYGNFEFINRTLSTSYAGPLVAIEASNTNPATSSAGRYTFYGRFNGYNATDFREPIATQWQTRILSNATFGQNTDVIVWRDPGVTQAPFACGGNPAWYPLPLESLILFDEQEQPIVPVPSNAFAAAAQRVPASSLGAPFASGYLRASFSLPSGTGSTEPPVDPLARQAYVFAVTSSNGKYGIGLAAFALDSACVADHFDVTVQRTAVSFTIPADTVTGVSRSTTVRFFFNQNVAVTASAFKLECPALTPVTFTTAPAPPGNTSLFTLTPSANLPATTTCTATAVASQITGLVTIGQHPAADKVITFTTGP